MPPKARKSTSKTSRPSKPSKSTSRASGPSKHSKSSKDSKASEDSSKTRIIPLPQFGPSIASRNTSHTIGSTPLKSSLSSTIAPRFVKDVVDPQLKDDINLNMQGNVDVEDFVKSVWGFNPEDLQWGKSWNFAPSSSLEKEYRAKGTEQIRYLPFCAMVEHAFNQWCKGVSIEPEERRTVHLTPNRNRTRIQGYRGFAGTHANERDPDIYAEVKTGPADAKADRWTWIGIPWAGEFKKDYLKPLGTRGQDGDDRQHSATVSSSRSTPPVPPVISSEPERSLKRKSERSDGSNKVPRKDYGSRPSTIVEDSVDDDVFTSVPSPHPSTTLSRARPPRVTNEQVQLAGYANEMFASVGNRRYVSGLFVKEDMVSLWYYDRIGIVRTKDFSIFKDPYLFVLVAVAVSVCDRKHFGYEPLLTPENDVVNPSTVENSTLILSPKHTVDGAGAPVQKPIAFEVQGKPLYIQYGIVGRGTVVYSVKPKEKGGLTFPEGKLIAKLSWPVKSRVAEDFLIRDIRSKIPPVWAKHIPELLCSMTLDGAALSLPRSLMASLDGSAEERVLRLLIARHAHELKDVKSIEEFKAIFIRLVRCHRVVFVKAKVLHRDLSVGNLMFLREDDKDPLALLNDWDLGKPLPADEESETTTARHRTGTAPFMAIDLLRDDPPPHLYRHDLESFMYILIWCAIHFNLNGSQAPCIHKAVEGWVHGTWAAIGSQKDQFFASQAAQYRKSIYDAITPAFRPVQKWIQRLVLMFNEGSRARMDRTDTLERLELEDDVEAPEAWNEDTLNGTVTYEKFMAAIGEDPRIAELDG